MLSIDRTTRRFALTALVGLTLVACSDDRIDPMAPTAPDTDAAAFDLDRASGTFELPTDGKIRKPSARPFNPKRLSLTMDDSQAGAGIVWTHVTGEGALIRSYASLQDALDALVEVPVMRGRHVGVRFDFTSREQFVSILDEILDEQTSRLGNFEIQDLMSTYQNDPSQLSDDERRYVRFVLLPHVRVHEDLVALRDAAAQGTPMARSLWTILRVFVETLTSAEDNRFGDHDDDGTINARDDDYEGTLWSNGPITVSGGGDNSEIGVGRCFDPCPSGIPVPGCD